MNYIGGWFVPTYAGTRPLAVDPSDSNKMYVGGYKIRKTTDGGKTWEELFTPSTGVVSALAIDPKNNQTIYAGVFPGQPTYTGQKGTWKSTDGGKNWIEINKGLNSQSESSLLILLDPNNSQILYTTQCAAKIERMVRVLDEDYRRIILKFSEILKEFKEK